jgi:hypothetical protein
MWGGLLNGVAILLFLVLTVRSILPRRSRAVSQPAAPPVTEEESRDRQAAQVRAVHSARVFWFGALACFLIAGTTGALMRYWLWLGFPPSVNLVNVQHAHSHLMYFAWVTPALMALIAARLPARTGRPVSRGMWAAVLATLVLGLLSYPLFFLWGYDLAEIGGRRLPAAVIFASLNMVAWYVYMLQFGKATRGLRRDRPLKLWRAALAFLFVASLGAWGRAVLAALAGRSFLSAALFTCS